MKKQNLDTDTQREDDVRRHREKPHEDKAEIRVMLPQAKEHQRWPASHERLGERRGSHRALRRNTDLQMP